MTTTPKPRLRWYQYSLRSLFVLTVLVAIAGSWFAVKRQQKDRERAAVKWITEMGGYVGYDWEWKTGGGPNAQPPGPSWLRAWLGDDFLAHVEVVVFVDKTFTDAMGNPKGLRRLESLDLVEKQVTNAGLEHLIGRNQLRQLRRKRTQVTDTGLEHLKGLTQLSILGLDNTQVTDAGLENLKGLTRLQELYLKGTNVTDEGVKRLQEALPNCKIVR